MEHIPFELKKDSWKLRLFIKVDKVFKTNLKWKQIQKEYGEQSDYAW